MREKQKKPSLIEAISINLKASKEISRVCPGLFSSLAAANALEAVNNYLFIFITARLLNELVGQCRVGKLIQWAVFGAIAALIVELIVRYFHRRSQLLEEVSGEAIERLYMEKLFSMDFADVDKHSTHDLLAQIRQNERSVGFGFGAVPGILSDIIYSLTSVLSGIGLTVSLFTSKVTADGPLRLLNSPFIILAAVLILMGISYLAGTLNKKAESNWTHGKELSAKSNRVRDTFVKLGRSVLGAADIRLYRQEKIALNHIRSEDAYGPGGAVDKLVLSNVGVLFGLSQGGQMLFTGGAYVLICLKALGGAFAIGSVTQYAGALALANFTVFNLFGAAGRLTANASYLKTANRFFEIPNLMVQGTIPTEKRNDREYDVEFRDVSFKYPGADTWALRQLNVRFKVGARYAVVGENGSGKTTFIKLLCRLYDPQEGQILLNGIDIKKYDYREYMDLFSVVFQDFQLFSQPLGANVAGSADYDAGRVKTALEEAGFGERLKELPQGLDTCLYRDFGDDGINISGGEAQKIAIARALYKNAPFLILDEPTAALDPIAEADIYAHLGGIVGDRTAIFISHRLSSCRFCDEILVFDAGRIVQRGSHEALVSDKNGRYSAFWQAQAQYYKEDR
ncbi:MAG: ABC transporter ATP-binding protein [Clostridia bacterium]|nr:ABC transporter ATP-binding protein [Clostridia bacterium]